MGNSVTWNLGIDVGGTFTDLVAHASDGRLLSAKSPSTPDQSDGVINAIGKAAAQLELTTAQLLAQTELIVHGTTVATNALLEYRGATVGLLTTEGFRDELEFRRSYKESVFNPRLKPPHPICPRELRIGIAERVDHEGNILTPLDEKAVLDALRKLVAEGVDAIAVCFLFSFVNPAHERRVAELIRQEAPDTFVSLSCEVLPEIREFERVSTTVVNAFTGPTIRAYITHLETKLRDTGFDGELFIMQSNGGVLTIMETSRFAVDTLLSGPAGGVTAASYIGQRAGYENLITVDMGGTSYDMSVIKSARPSVTTESWIGRYRIAKPMLDIHTIGAGGGSIAWIDEGGALAVGPKSAGATPGPACYAQGGELPTVTDVNLLLGYLNPDFFLGGEMLLDTKLAFEAVRSHIAAPMDMDNIEAALAVSEIVNNNMANASHFVTTKRGLDPQDFALLAVGGAGAIHAGRQAELLGISTVIIPRLAPVFCALGDNIANLKVSEARTYFQNLASVDLGRLNEIFGELEQLARNRLSSQDATRNFEVHRHLDLRYEGEVHELTVPLRSRIKRVTSLNLGSTVNAFHDLHEQLYAHKDPDQPIEILTVRLELIGVRELPAMLSEAFDGEDPSGAVKGERTAYFDTEPTTLTLYDGDKLRPGNFIEGPAIIEQWGTTIVVYPKHEALMDAFGNCIIEIA